MNQPRVDDEWIREHGGFVRSLSRSILRGVDRDDAVQEAWLSALLRPPETNAAAWLRAVTRRLVGRSRREEARRLRRERAVARPEAQPSTASLAEKAEILRLVGEVVTTLREPYREALLLRYYEELPPREIAARLEVPVATVNSRIQRGLRLARKELEGRRGGHGRPWTETLAVAVGLDPRRLAPASGTLVTLGVVGMKTKTWFVLGSFALVVVSALGLREWGRDVEPVPTPQASGPLAAQLPSAEEPLSTRSPAAVERERVAATLPEDPVVSRRDRRIGGSVLDPSGGPVLDAEILIGPDARELRVTASSDADGSFLLDIAPEDQVVCARASGWSPSPLVRLPDPDIESRPVELRLPARGAQLVVTVVDAVGHPVAGAHVFAGREEERLHRSADGSLATTIPGFREPTEGNGVARFEGLAVGWIRVGVTHPGFAPQTVFATLQPEEENAVDVRLEEGFFVEGVVRDGAGRAVEGAVLTRGSSRARTETSDADGFFRFGPIDSGKVVVTGPLGRGVETRLDGAPGETVSWSPVLRADATLRGCVLDGEGRGRQGLAVTAHDDTWPGWKRGATTDARGYFAIYGCPDGRLRLEVRDGRAANLPVFVREGVEAGPEEVRFVVTNEDPVTVRGSVSVPDGLLPELRIQHRTTPGRQRLTAGSGAILGVEDDVFELEGVPPGHYRLVAVGAPFGWMRVLDFDVASEDVDLGHVELPSPGTLSTTLLRPVGTPTTVARFLLENRESLETILDIVGEFPERLELAPGRYVLQVEVTPGPQREYTVVIESGRTRELQVDLRSECTHRVLVRYRSGRRPTGAVELVVRQLDVPRTVAEAEVATREGDAWVHEVVLEPGRFEFLARTRDGREAIEIRNLFTSTPGREIELTVEDA